ncbi:MAG TPA: glycosyltransferase family 39 protein [Candidatus Polarisedimenticolaceae bacterium]|nr:glycosyltransferase family 39 protein [Candidatus Polarisedimenticolaceae bacterium]
MRKRFAAGLIVAAAAWLGGTVIDRDERSMHLTLDCRGATCTAQVDGGTPLVLRMPGASAGRRIGLYAYHPYEFDRPAYFRQLRLRSLNSAAGVDLTLLRPLDRGFFARDQHWLIAARRGLTHEAALGERSVLWLPQARVQDFALDVDLVSSVDSGLIFRASDQGNGMVLAVRSRCNDIFFFPLENGEPGPILEIEELRPLAAWREGLRLAGLTGQLIVVSAAFLWALRGLLTWGARLELPRALSRDETPAAGPPRWVLPALFVLTVGAHVAVVRLGLEGIPHIADETAYLFQAKIFAAGHLWAPPPEHPDFFKHEHVILTADRWFGKYPPGFPLLLSLGVRLGMPWLINPLLGGLVGWITYRLTREFAGWRWGILAWLLLLSSPVFVITGGTLMSHMASALFVSAYLLLFLGALRRGSGWRAALAGACLGAGLLSRPFGSFLSGLVGAGYGAVLLVRGPRRWPIVKVGILAALAVAPFVALYLGWNALLSEGHGFNGYAAYDAKDTLGFGPDKGSDWLRTWGSFGHTPAKALRSAHQYLDYTSMHLLGWPGRLSFSFALAGVALARRRRDRWLLAALFAVLVVGHMFYWATQHLGYGARYWFCSVPALLVLSALGLQALVERARVPDRRGGEVLCLAAVLLVLVACNGIGYFPQRFAELPHYGGIGPQLKQEVERGGLDRAVVFVRTQGIMFNDGFFLNDPWLHDGAVFAIDLGPRNQELLRAYPHFRGYLWADDTLRPLEVPDDTVARGPAGR